MTTRSNNACYSSASITMHWAMVLLFIVVYVLVNLADGFEKGSAQRQSARDWHATFGLLIFALVWLRIVLREGKKRQIRQMTGAVGYPTLLLVRWAIGPLLLGDVELGQCKALTPTEVRTLRHAVGLETATPRPKPSKPSPSTRTSTRSAYGARSPRAKAPARGFDKRRPPRPRRMWWSSWPRNANPTASPRGGTR